MARDHKNPKILLVYSDTGGGHRTAANAVKSALIELCEKDGHGVKPEVFMEDIIEKSNSVNRLFEHTYNRLLKNKQDWMKYYIALIEWVKPNESDVGYRMISSYTKKLITDLQPDVIVSVHPMVNHYIARTLKDLNMQDTVRLITVLTDPNANLWTGWACPDAHLTIAPNDLAYDKLVSFGLDPNTIHVMGMPILPQFLKAPTESREQLLSRLKLDPGMATVAITAGSAGGGNMFKIYQALHPERKDVQVIFVCGKNAKLQAQVEEEAKKHSFRTVALPYATAVADGMNACDLLVTKAGGLTTFEAIARRLPMAIDMVTEPMPQESGTIDMLIEAGLAKAVKKPADIVPIVEAIEVIPNRLEKPLPKEHNLDRVDAVYEISRMILDHLQPAGEASICTRKFVLKDHHKHDHEHDHQH